MKIAMLFKIVNELVTLIIFLIGFMMIEKGFDDLHIYYRVLYKWRVKKLLFDIRYYVSLHRCVSTCTIMCLYEPACVCVCVCVFICLSVLLFGCLFNLNL